MAKNSGIEGDALKVLITISLVENHDVAHQLLAFYIDSLFIRQSQVLALWPEDASFVAQFRLSAEDDAQVVYISILILVYIGCVCHVVINIVGYLSYQCLHACFTLGV